MAHILRFSVPSDDILHARIQTMGVAEHIFDVDIHGKSVTWHLFDVGGARGQRHSWVPYFDDANAIIFVAPVSAFDQVRFSFWCLPSLSHLFFISLSQSLPLISYFFSVSGGRSEDKPNRRLTSAVYANLLQRPSKERAPCSLPEYAMIWLGLMISSNNSFWSSR